MTTKTPFTNLAVAIADCLEHPDTPRELADILVQANDPLTDLLVGSGSGYLVIATTLRALAGRIESGDGTGRAELEKTLTAHQGAI